MPICLRLLAAIFLLASNALCLEEWKAIWLYDELETRMDLRKVVYRSQQHLFAVGILKSSRVGNPVLLESRDGGKSWNGGIRLDDPATDLFCIATPKGDGPCWYSTLRGVHGLDPATGKWPRLSKLKGPLVLHFHSATEGVAAGVAKSAWTTSDGGRNWTKLKITDEIQTKPEYSVFHFVAAEGPFVFLGGSSSPPRADVQDQIWPDWMVPDDATKRREIPRAFFSLQSKDRGKVWLMDSTSSFGFWAAMTFSPDLARSYALVQMRNKFDFASALVEINLKTGKSREVAHFDIMATDLAVRPDGLLQVVGVEALPLRTAPIPSRVHVMTLDPTLATGLAMAVSHKVDYRALGKNVRLVKAPDGSFTVMVDTGMLLQRKQ